MPLAESTVQTPPAERKADRFPMIIAEWARNSRELVRIALGRFKNRFTIEIRVWWRDANGAFKPGRDGLTLGVWHLPKLAAGFNNAHQRAEVLGLVESAFDDQTATDHRHGDRSRNQQRR